MPATPPPPAGPLLLPVPQVPGQRSSGPNEGPVTFTPGHHFSLAGDIDLGELAVTAAAPLSVIVQVTKRCEPGRGPAGVSQRRGAAAAPRPARDRGHVLRVHRGPAGQRHPGRGDGAAAGREGGVRHRRLQRSAATSARVRGDYDRALAGLRALAGAGLPVSLSAVVLRSALHALPYLYRIADVLDCGKLKLILPLRKGNALGLAGREFISAAEARDLCALPV